ncbi:MAG: Do family serine endopeptidase [Candidatus Synoicihabitans palmerolidicus]|nr:Do family serine endopeptidase [Candidatus Synoicihabitans palmerolidicus]
MNTSYSRHPQCGRALRASVVLLAAAALGWTAAAAIANDKTAEKKVVVQVDSKPLDREGRGGMRVSFSSTVKRVAPAVVQVSVTAEVPESSPGNLSSFLQDPRFRRYFGLPENFKMPRQEPQREAGSGVIVSSDGYILTNNHVVQNAAEIEVILDDGREMKATVVGTDSESDLAVIKVEAEDLLALTFADSDHIEVGDTVLAVGNAFGLGQTVTSGMISALGRATMGLAYEDFIQTDAAINPGNSGGALVDTEGRLVGINTAILSRSGGFQGIGFAIPSNLARSVMQQLATHGKVFRGYLGVTMDPLTPALSEQLGLERDQQGVIIGEVVEDSPAAEAGLKPYDIITRINGREFASIRELRFAVADIRPGEKAEITIIRDEEEMTVDATLASRDGEVALNGGPGATEDEGTLNGVAVADLTPQARRQFGIQSRIDGALVVQVERNSAAADAGLREGDVILEINQVRVRSAEDAVALTEESTASMKTLLRVYNMRRVVRYMIVDESGER